MLEKSLEAIVKLTEEVSELKRLLIEKQEQPQAEQFLTLKEAAEILRLAVSTVYSKVHRGELPVMKRGNRLYFLRTELMDYIKQGRKPRY